MKNFWYIAGVCLLAACSSQGGNANEAGFATVKPDTIDIEQEFAKPDPASRPTNSAPTAIPANTENLGTPEAETQHYKDDEPENQHTGKRTLQGNSN